MPEAVTATASSSSQDDFQLRWAQTLPEAHSDVIAAIQYPPAKSQLESHLQGTMWERYWRTEDMESVMECFEYTDGAHLENGLSYSKRDGKRGESETERNVSTRLMFREIAWTDWWK